jgi:hypothetical protein
MRNAEEAKKQNLAAKGGGRAFRKERCRWWGGYRCLGANGGARSADPAGRSRFVCTPEERRVSGTHSLCGAR